MKYYHRVVTQRKAINRFGRLGYIQVHEFVKTNNIDPFNKGKRIKFVESDLYLTKLVYLNADQIYSEDGEVVSRRASNYRR